MKKNFSLGKWFIITGLFTLLTTYVINNKTLASPDTNEIQVRIKKTTENSEERPGSAKMVLLDKNNKKVKEFDVVTNVGYTELENIIPGEYTLKEIITPDGYAFGADLLIDVLDKTDVQTFEFINLKSDAIKLSVAMRDIALNTLVENSKIQLLDNNNTVIDTCDSADYSPCIFQNLNVGTYKIKEINTPPGYISISDKSFEVTETDVGKTIQIVESRDFTRVEICKIDSNSGEQLSNAVFELYDSDGNLYDKWTTDKYIRYLERIPIGTYTLKEVSAPPGYDYKKEDHTIIVTENPEIVYIKAYNSPSINVPNTAVNSNVIFYFIGGFLLLLGVIAFVISYKQNYKK